VGQKKAGSLKKELECGHHATPRNEGTEAERLERWLMSPGGAVAKQGKGGSRGTKEETGERPQKRKKTTTFGPTPEGREEGAPEATQNRTVLLGFSKSVQTHSKGARRYTSAGVCFRKSYPPTQSLYKTGPPVRGLHSKKKSQTAAKPERVWSPRTGPKSEKTVHAND